MLELTLKEMSVKEFRDNIKNQIDKMIKEGEIDANSLLNSGFPRFDLDTLNTFVESMHTHFIFSGYMTPSCLIRVGRAVWIVFNDTAILTLDSTLEEYGIKETETKTAVDNIEDSHAK